MKRIRFSGGKPAIQKFATPDKQPVFALVHDGESLFVLGSKALIRYPEPGGWLEKPSSWRDYSDALHYDACVVEAGGNRFVAVGVRNGLEILDAVSLTLLDTLPWGANILRVAALADGAVACADAAGRRFRVALPSKQVEEFPLAPGEGAPVVGSMVVDEHGDLIVATTGGWILWYASAKVHPVAVRVTDSGLRGLAADRDWAWVGQGQLVAGFREKGRERASLEPGGGRVVALARRGKRLASLDDKGTVSVFEIPPADPARAGRPALQVRTDLTGGACLLLTPWTSSGR